MKGMSWIEILKLVFSAGTFVVASWVGTLIYNLGANGEVFKQVQVKVASHEIAISEATRIEKEDFEKLRTLSENLMVATMNLSGTDRVHDTQLAEMHKQLDELRRR